MKRSRSSPSQSPPQRQTKKTKQTEMSVPQENSPPGPAPAALPARSRMAIEHLLSEPAETSTSTEDRPLVFLSQDDLCVKQPFEIYLTYAQAISGRYEELADAQRELDETRTLIQELNSELERAENARPRRARIIGPIRTRLQSVQTQQGVASERVDSAETKVAFSRDTMHAMAAILLKFGWLIRHDDEIRLQPHSAR